MKVATILLVLFTCQGHARFSQADTWQGDNSQPITLNKYLYANADPVNMIDPSGHFSIAGAMGGTVNMMTRTVKVLRAGTKRFLKTKRWAIYHVKLPQGIRTFSHEFIWAKNIRNKKAIGYHVTADTMDMTKSKKYNISVPGEFFIVPQKKINVVPILGRVSIASRARVGLLGTVGFALWNKSTVGFMHEGDSCPFNYRISDSSCKHWTAKAAKKAKYWSLFPL